MDRQKLQMLRSLPIEGVAERLGLRVTRHKCLCPFHEDSHPSLSFLVRKNTFRCFVCGASGGVIDLAMKVLGNDFLDACRWLADEHNIILTEWKPAEKTIPAKPFDAARYERFFQRPYLNEAARRFLYQDRLLDPRVVRWCRLTSWTDLGGTNWLQTPYYDMDGKLVGVQNRNLDYRKGTDGIRFRFPSGSQCHIYNLPVLKMLREGEPLYITEGCSDCWAMLSAGHKAIAIPSATLLKPEDAKMLSELTQRLSSKVRMYPDQDLPGETLFRQLQKILPAIEHHQLPAGCKDFAEYYVNIERKEAEDEAV